MYEAARSYLELPQRIDLLNARVEVRTLRLAVEFQTASLLLRYLLSYANVYAALLGSARHAQAAQRVCHKSARGAVGADCDCAHRYRDP
jgi:hypothetical protein